MPFRRHRSYRKNSSAQPPDAMFPGMKINSLSAPVRQSREPESPKQPPPDAEPADGVLPNLVDQASKIVVSPVQALMGIDGDRFALGSALQHSAIFDGIRAPPQTAISSEIYLHNNKSKLLMHGDFSNCKDIPYYEHRPAEEKKLREAIADLCTSPHDYPHAAMIVGQPGSGKSCLLSSFLRSQESFFTETCKVNMILRFSAYQLTAENRLSASDLCPLSEVFCCELLVALNVRIEQCEEYVLSKSKFDILHHALKSLPRPFRRILLILEDATPSDEHVQVALRLTVDSPLRLLVVSRHFSSVPAVCRSKVVQLDEMDSKQLSRIIRSQFPHSKVKTLFSSDQVEFFASKWTFDLPLFANLIAGQCTSLRDIGEFLAALKALAPYVNPKDNNSPQQTRAGHSLIQAIVNRQSSENRRYLFAFTIFDLGCFVQVDDLAILWNCKSVLDASEICQQLCWKGLIKSAAHYRFANQMEETKAYGLHPLIHHALIEYFSRPNSSANYNISQLWQMLVSGDILRHPSALSMLRPNVIELSIKLHRKPLLQAIVRRFQANVKLPVPSETAMQHSWLENAWQWNQYDVMLGFLCLLFDKMLVSEPSLLDYLVAKTKSNLNKILLSAVENSCQKLTMALLERGANANESWSPTGETVLMVAARKGSRSIVKQLLSKGANPNVSSENGQTPLHLAASYGNEDVVRLLYQNKATIDKRNKWLETPLMRACEYGHRHIVSRLLKKGANASNETLNLWNESPLLIAVKNDHDQVVRLLLEVVGFNLAKFVIPSSNKTPLIFAIERGNDAMAKLLIETTTSPFSVERCCMHVLMSAAKGDGEQLEGLLTHCGDRIEPANHHVETAVKFSAVGGNFTVLKMFFEHEKVLSQNLGELVASITQQIGFGKKLHAGQRACLRLLLREGANPNVVASNNSNGNSGLMLAAGYGDEETVRLFVQNGANANFRNRFRDTALILAVKNYRNICSTAESIVNILLEAGADPRKVNEEGLSALQMTFMKRT